LDRWRNIFNKPPVETEGWHRGRHSICCERTSRSLCW